MSQQAKVADIDALDAFRAALIVFVTKARTAVDGVRDKVKRTRNWLQTDQRMFWEGEIRRRQRKLDRAQQELYSARLTKMTETITMREAAVRKAKAAVDRKSTRLNSSHT